MFAKNGLRVKAKEPRNYFDSGPSLSWSGLEGATEVAEREETADAVGVVGDGAVADSTVVGGHLLRMALGCPSDSQARGSAREIKMQIGD